MTWERGRVRREERGKVRREERGKVRREERGKVRREERGTTVTHQSAGEAQCRGVLDVLYQGDDVVWDDNAVSAAVVL